MPRIAVIVIVCVVALISRAIYRRHIHPLSHIPGPYLASITRLWLLFHALRGEQHRVHLAVHKKYGSVVRVGPNHILLSDPAHGPRYYTWEKSNWWLCFRPNDHHLAFSTELGLKAHNAKKKRVAGAYSMTSLLANEQAMDRRIGEFIQQLDRMAVQHKTVNMADWLNYLNFDILMDLVFSEPPGFVRQGKDVKGLIAANNMFVWMAQIIGIFPMFYSFMQLPLISRMGPQPTDTDGAGLLFGIAERSVQARLEARASDGSQKQSNGLDSVGTEGRPTRDMLQIMSEYRDAQDEPIPKDNLKNEAIVAMASGADTVACALRVAALHISTNPIVHARLCGELDGAEAAGQLSKPVRFEEAKRLPYLGAIIQELVRIHPVMASPFWRSAPDGASADGYILPKGTHVGINEWAVSRNTDLYGDDVEVFRPERWLECDAELKKRREKNDIFFGHGDYMCLGRNFASLELHKVLVEVWRRFDIVVANPERPWRSTATISFVHKDFMCSVHARKNASTKNSRSAVETPP